MTELLAVDSLRVRFRSLGWAAALAKGVSDPFLDAVYDVTFHLDVGETLGLVGESGSGKTTLMRALLGLVDIHSGSIRFQGHDLVGLATAEHRKLRRHIGFIFQDPVASLSPRKTVRSLILEPRRIHNMPLTDPETEARRLLDMVGLNQGFLDAYPHQLSGGQARRVGVARALALEPALIIADEPTAGLDVSVQGEVLNLMSELQQRLGLSYLIVTHNLPMVRHVSDRLAIMYLGRLVEHGPTDAIFERPSHPYTKALMEAVPQPDPDRRRSDLELKGEVPSLRQRPSGCEFHTRCLYVQDLCRTKPPAYHGGDRSVRCHFPLAHASDWTQANGDGPLPS